MIEPLDKADSGNQIVPPDERRSENALPSVAE